VIAGIDYSTHAVDVVLLDEDSDAATWHRFPLVGANAFDRVRAVRDLFAGASLTFRDAWESVLAIGIEDPRGYNAGALYRIQGAILTKVPRGTLVHPLPPQVWRKTVGLPGNASKGHVYIFANEHRTTTYELNGRRYHQATDSWPQDACDAYCIALATRTLLVTA
jgi:hypothetical protein